MSKQIPREENKKKTKLENKEEKLKEIHNPPKEKQIQKETENITGEVESQDEEEDIKISYKVPKNLKTSLIDPLDILKKEPTIIPIEKQLEKHLKKTENIPSEKEIHQKKYNSGLVITYTEDSDKEMEIVSIKKNSVNQKILKDLEISLDSSLELYIKKVFCKFNYSPIIKRIFGPKTTFLELEELSLIWKHYIQLNILNNEKLVEEFKKKIFKISSVIIQYLIKHIFSIIKIREAIYSIQNCFQIHYFNILKKGEIKHGENAFNFKCIRVNPKKEIEGNGACFILIKELKRSLNMLLYSTKYFFYSFGDLFNNDFHFMYMIQRKIYYEYFEQNCFFSSLLFNMKGIFIRSDYKEVCNEIDNLTVSFEDDFNYDMINEKYAKIDLCKEGKELLFDFQKCYNQLNYLVDKNDEKGEQIIVETEEEKKINEIKDVDELLKYINDGPQKKKKKKKKKNKDDPINILDKFILEDKKLDDELVSQSDLSIISGHDSVVSAFKREIRNDNIYNNFVKTKPILSDEFLSKII